MFSFSLESAAGLACVINLLVQAKEAETVSSQGKDRGGGGELKEGWQVLVLNLLRGTQLPPGAFYQWGPVQADVIRLGRYCPLGRKEKQMFSEYVTGQDQFSLGLALANQKSFVLAIGAWGMPLHTNGRMTCAHCCVIKNPWVQEHDPQQELVEEACSFPCFLFL